MSLHHAVRGAGDAPSLVLGGSSASSFPSPGAEHPVIESAAHIANVEQPEAFTAALLRHLGSNGGSA